MQRVWGERAFKNTCRLVISLVDDIVDNLGANFQSQAANYKRTWLAKLSNYN